MSDNLEIRRLLAVLAVEAHMSFPEARKLTMKDAEAVIDVLAEKNKN